MGSRRLEPPAAYAGWILTGVGRHQISIPLHFAPTVDIQAQQRGTWLATAKNGKTYRLSLTSDADFEAAIEDARASPSYGVALPIKRLVWRTTTSLPVRVEISIAPFTAADL